MADEDGDVLTMAYAMSADEDVLTADVDDQMHLVLEAHARGTVAVELTLEDEDGNTVSDTFAVRANERPTAVEPLLDMTLAVGGNAEVDLTNVFRDAEDGAVAEVVAMSDDEDIVLTIATTAGELVLVGRAAGTATVTVTATDSDGAAATDAFTVTVGDGNDAPVVASVLADLDVTKGTPVEVSLADTFTDPNGDALTYTATSPDPSLVATELQGAMLTVHGMGMGTVTLTVTAADPRTAMAETMFNVAVTSRPAAGAAIGPLALQLGADAQAIDLGDAFVDEDNDPLTLTLSASQVGIVEATLAGDTLTLEPLARGSVTLELTAADPRGRAATQAVAVTVSDTALQGVANRSLAGLGRSTLASVANALGTRMEASGAATPLSLASALGAMGLNLPAGGHRSAGFDPARPDGMRNGTGAFGMASTIGTDAALAPPRDARGMQPGAPRRELGWRAPRDFALRVNGREGVGSWTVWSRSDRQAYGGDGFDGTAAAAYLGVDVQATPRWLLGVAASRSRGRSDYRFGTAERQFDTALTTLLPYAKYEPNARTRLWGVYGSGAGELATTAVGRDADATSDLTLALGMVGGRYALDSLGTVQLAVRGDAAFADLATAAGADAAAGLGARVTRVRAGVEGSFTRELAYVGTVTPFAELHLRRDGGDGSVGTGLEVAGGLRIVGQGFDLEARGRTLATSTAAGYRESGYSLTATIQPSIDGTGAFVTLQPSWGGSALDANAIWHEGPLVGTPHADGMSRTLAPTRSLERARSLLAKVGYGLTLRHERYLLTPFVDVDTSDAYRQVRVGATLEQRFTASGRLGLELAAGRAERHAVSDDTVGLTLSMQF